MKQTAVEYLVKEFSDILGPLDIKPMQDLLLVDAIKRAKEMEEQQMIAFALFRDNYFETAETLDEFTKSNVNLVKLFKQQEQ
jgi:hypothetical protein